MKLPRIGWLLCCLSMMLYIGQPLLTGTAEAATCQHCSGYSYNGATGSGDGACGVCEDVVKTWTIGTCVDDSNPDNSCTTSSYYALQTDHYLCDASGWSIALGVLIGVVCGAGEIACAIGCASVCVGSVGTACLACLAGCGIVGGACLCGVKEAFCPCSFSHSTYDNATSGCIS